MTTFLDTNVGGHLEVTIFERVDLNLNVAAFHDTKYQMLSGMWNTICYVVFSVTRWHAICNAARWEKYQLKEDRWSALKRKKLCGLVIFPLARKCHLSAEGSDTVLTLCLFTAGWGTCRCLEESRTTTAQIPPVSTRSTRNLMVC